MYCFVIVVVVDVVVIVPIVTFLFTFVGWDEGIKKVK